MRQYLTVMTNNRTFQCEICWVYADIWRLLPVVCRYRNISPNRIYKQAHSRKNLEPSTMHDGERTRWKHFSELTIWQESWDGVTMLVNFVNCSLHWGLDQICYRLRKQKCLIFNYLSCYCAIFFLQPRPSCHRDQFEGLPQITLDRFPRTWRGAGPVESIDPTHWRLPWLTFIPPFDIFCNPHCQGCYSLCHFTINK